MNAIHGRGASDNPANRFEPLHYAVDPDEPPGVDEDEALAPQTVLYQDASRSVVSYNDSPDVGFDASVNPYRGCEHGCIYCYARPTHEYFGLSIGLDFETRIMVKQNAPELLREALMHKSWQPQVLAFSGVTDCYQPAERRLRLTRRCLEVAAEFRNPISIVTKNHLVSRDVDVLQQMAQWHGAVVNVSVTTLDDRLAAVLEPRASRPQRRLDAIRRLSDAGVPVGVMVAPVLPALNDTEIPAILKAVREAGARRANYVMLRLPHGLGPLFEGWLERHFPDRKDKVLNRIRDMRGGKLNDPRFGDRMRGQGLFADHVDAIFEMTRRRLGFDTEPIQLSTDHFCRPGPAQMTLF